MGAKAGLSLYDIAIMCCRNDNAGEVPFKLEVLAAVASELASSAVENGHYHHVCRLHGLGRRALFLRREYVAGQHEGIPEHRLQVGVDLRPSLYGTDSSTISRSELPTITQCTGLDTSSDSGDCEECEEWAAAVIADVSLEKRMSILQTSSQFKPRFTFVCSEHSSDTNLSFSPRGFWYISPGSSPEGEELDADSISLSPHLMHKDGDVEDRNFGQGVDETSKTPRMFADYFSGGFRLTPPATVNMSTFKKAESSDSGMFAATKKKAGGLNRSQSFSAISELRRSSTISSRSGESSGLASIDESEKFRGYFCKFVDLVIVREATALVSLQMHEEESLA